MITSVLNLEPTFTINTIKKIPSQKKPKGDPR
jgi:hypothetical protein